MAALDANTAYLTEDALCMLHFFFSSLSVSIFSEDLINNLSSLAFLKDSP